MPQMHPLLWTLLFSFSFICLISTMMILYFTFQKPNTFSMKNILPQSAKNLSWKW